MNNIFMRAYCRTFQAVFRAALPLLPYREPKRLKVVSDVAALLAEKKKSHVLIVTDRTISALGLTEPLKQALADAGIGYTVYDDTVPNPTVDNVEQARQAYISSRSKAIIAFGGGSPMDCAKAVGARIARPRKSVQRMRGLLKILHPIPTLIAIPTTAGTGSETTLAAVITDSVTHHKYPINDFSLIPHYALLDAGVTVGLPRHITATTGMDALTHAIEAYIGRSTTAYTREMAVRAVKLISEYLPIAYANGTDTHARAQMLDAAYCAGVAFTRSYVGYVHGIAHSLGGQYSTPHGLANAVLLPYVLEEYGTHAHKKLARLAKESGIVRADTPDAEAAEGFIARIRKMNASMDIPEKLSGIKSGDIPRMAALAAKECNPLYPVPKLMSAKELERLYYAVSEETK